jgi:hypothetical protein
MEKIKLTTKEVNAFYEILKGHAVRKQSTKIPKTIEKLTYQFDLLLKISEYFEKDDNAQD